VKAGHEISDICGTCFEDILSPLQRCYGNIFKKCKIETCPNYLSRPQESSVGTAGPADIWSVTAVPGFGLLAAP